MVEDYFIDFLRGDFLSTAIDHLAAAAHEKQVPVVIEVTEVSCLEPIAGKCGFVRLRVAVVSLRDACTPDDDLARLAAAQQSPLFVHDRDIQHRWYSDRTRLAPKWRQRIARDGR